jgi:hypothetical protein
VKIALESAVLGFFAQGSIALHTKEWNSTAPVRHGFCEIDNFCCNSFQNALKLFRLGKVAKSSAFCESPGRQLPALGIFSTSSMVWRASGV